MNTPATPTTTNAPSNAPPGATDTTLPALIPIPQAAALLGLSRASAYRYAAAGELPTKRFGRRVYVITNRIGDLLTAPIANPPRRDAA